jgi:hypothetical protein
MLSDVLQALDDHLTGQGSLVLYDVEFALDSDTRDFDLMFGLCWRRDHARTTDQECQFRRCREGETLLSRLLPDLNVSVSSFFS